MTLTEFVTARLDEDEAAARTAKPGPWTLDGASIYAGHPTEEVVDWVYDGSWDHIARHDPARVLAQVAAMRAIVELAEGLNQSSYPLSADRLMRHLAAIWRDHPDYDPAWAPD